MVILLVVRLWNYFCGYVIIKIEGLTLEKFINLSIVKDIYLWDIIRIDYTTLEAKISIKDFKKLRVVIRRVGCRVRIIEKKGFPFFMHKFKYRKMLAFGFAISLCILFFLTSFIWSIDVLGSDEVEPKAILQELDNVDITVGLRKSDIDIDEIERLLLKNFSDLSYVHAHIKGTKLIVEVKKRDNPPINIDKNTPCNIISKKRAVIQKVIAKNGRALVEKGDIVKNGQILISGVITDEKFDNPLLVHSTGEVYGFSYYTEIIKEPIINQIEERTGRVYKTKELKLGNNSIHLTKGEIPFKNYQEDKVIKKPFDFQVFTLPFEIVFHEYKEVKIKQIKQNIDSLKKISSVKGVQKLMKEIPQGVKVISKDVVFSEVNNILETKVTIEVLEQIGVKKLIKSEDVQKYYKKEENN